MIMVEDLVNANQSNQFLQAWQTIDEHFNVTNPNLLRSMIIDRLNNFRYDQSSMTVGGACVMLEEMWEPLIILSPMTKELQFYARFLETILCL